MNERLCQCSPPIGTGGQYRRIPNVERGWFQPAHVWNIKGGALAALWKWFIYLPAISVNKEGNRKVCYDGVTENESVRSYLFGKIIKRNMKRVDVTNLPIDHRPLPSCAIICHFFGDIASKFRSLLHFLHPRQIHLSIKAELLCDRKCCLFREYIHR